MAHSVGVTYEPEIFEFDLDPRSDVMLVLASDGVWDVMSAEDIRKVRPPLYTLFAPFQLNVRPPFRITNQRFPNPRPDSRQESSLTATAPTRAQTLFKWRNPLT